MEKHVLRKVQLTLFDMLLKIDEVCKQNGIKYWLDSGTLLGAVRHAGFIPWDDDLDIGMIRSDYNKFLRIAQKDLGDEFFVQNWHTDKNYGLTFTKVIKNNTRYSMYINRGVSAREGFFIDIFPYDVYPQNKYQQFKQKYIVWTLRGMIIYKSGYDMTQGRSFKSLLLSYPFKALSYLISKEKLIALYEKHIQDYNTSESDRLFGCNNIIYGKYVFNKEWVDNVVFLDFEGAKLPCPINYHEYLKMNYGNYMELPPLDKRENKHGIIDICFNTREEEF